MVEKRRTRDKLPTVGSGGEDDGTFCNFHRAAVCCDIVAAGAILAVFAHPPRSDGVGRTRGVVHHYVCGSVAGYRCVQSVAVSQHLVTTRCNDFGRIRANLQLEVAEIHLHPVEFLVHADGGDGVFFLVVGDFNGTRVHNPMGVTAVGVREAHFVGTIGEVGDGAIHAGDGGDGRQAARGSTGPAHRVGHRTSLHVKVDFTVVEVVAMAVIIRDGGKEGVGHRDGDIGRLLTSRIDAVADGEVVKTRTLTFDTVGGGNHLIAAVLAPSIGVAAFKAAGYGGLCIVVSIVIASTVLRCHGDGEFRRDGESQRHHTVATLADGNRDGDIGTLGEDTSCRSPQVVTAGGVHQRGGGKVLHIERKNTVVVVLCHPKGIGTADGKVDIAMFRIGEVQGKTGTEP